MRDVRQPLARSELAADAAAEELRRGTPRASTPVRIARVPSSRWRGRGRAGCASPPRTAARCHLGAHGTRYPAADLTGAGGARIRPMFRWPTAASILAKAPGTAPTRRGRSPWSPRRSPEASPGGVGTRHWVGSVDLRYRRRRGPIRGHPTSGPAERWPRPDHPDRRTIARPIHPGRRRRPGNSARHPDSADEATAGPRGASRRAPGLTGHVDRRCGETGCPSPGSTRGGTDPEGSGVGFRRRLRVHRAVLTLRALWR